MTEKSRYDWSKIPKEYEWAATDEDGDVYAFFVPPFLGKHAWQPSDGKAPLALGGGSNALYWVNSLEQRPKEGSMELDLSKPVRFKSSKKECWPTKAPCSPVQIAVVVVFKNTDGELEVGICARSELENIPEIVRIEQWVNGYPNGFIGAHPTRPSALNGRMSGALGNPVHLIFCHDPETGKTWAEVPEEDSCK